MYNLECCGGIAMRFSGHRRWSPLRTGDVASLPPSCPECFRQVIGWTYMGLPAVPLSACLTVEPMLDTFSPRCFRVFDSGRLDERRPAFVRRPSLKSQAGRAASPCCALENLSLLEFTGWTRTVPLPCSRVFAQF